jgi:hypothetical protein
VGFKAFVDYAHQPLKLTLKDGSGVAARQVVMSYQVVTRLQAHLSLFDWAEVALEAPLSAQSYGAAFGSTDDPFAPTGFYAARGPTNVPPPTAAPLDARVAVKLRTPRAGPVGFAIVAAATIPFGDESSFLGDAGFTFRPTGVIDLTSAWGLSPPARGGSSTSR